MEVGIFSVVTGRSCRLEVFKQLFQKRFVPPEYFDRKKEEFSHLRHGKMLANEYYRKFTDLSRYFGDC